MQRVVPHHHQLITGRRLGTLPGASWRVSLVSLCDKAGIDDASLYDKIEHRLGWPSRHKAVIAANLKPSGTGIYVYWSDMSEKRVDNHSIVESLIIKQRPDAVTLPPNEPFRRKAFNCNLYINSGPLS